MKVVRITWADAASARDWWNEPEGTCTPIPVTSVGILHEKTKKRVVISSWLDVNGRTGGLSVIPRSGITKIKRLK